MKGLKLNSESNVILNAAGCKAVTARAPVTLCGISQSNDLGISLANKKFNTRFEVKYNDSLPPQLSLIEFYWLPSSVSLLSSSARCSAIDGVLGKW